MDDGRFEGGHGEGTGLRSDLMLVLPESVKSRANEVLLGEFKRSVLAFRGGLAEVRRAASGWLKENGKDYGANIDDWNKVKDALNGDKIMLMADNQASMLAYGLFRKRNDKGGFKRVIMVKIPSRFYKEAKGIGLRSWVGVVKNLAGLIDEFGDEVIGLDRVKAKDGEVIPKGDYEGDKVYYLKPDPVLAGARVMRE